MPKCTTWLSALVAGFALFAVGCSDDSGQTATRSPILIEPQVRVGKVRAGMSRDQVLAELGKPDRQTANAFEYTKLGFAVLPGSNGVAAVMCGDVTGINGPLVKAFNGRTKEGIGMNSTREDVIKAFGEPTANEKFIAGLESMQYSPLGLTLTLEGGKVHHLIVRLQTNIDRTVNLPPPAEK
jgi:hypothetical protein